MVEEGQNQPLKQIRFEDEDGISKLPDSLIVEILSRLPETKYAIRTSALSKRWEHIWHSVLKLRFVHYNDVSPELFSSVDKTLNQRRQLKLKKFILDTCYDSRFESQIDNWIRYAVSCNVEELNLTLRRAQLWNADRINEFPLEEVFFSCSSFTDLKLSRCSFNPTGPISWRKLRSLRIWKGKLDEDLIANILSGSPVLETLVLDNCYGYRRINITSRSVKTLVLSGYGSKFEDENFEINAPNILSLKIHDGVSTKRLLLQNVSSLVEADLDYWLGPTAEHGEDTLKGLILKLLHVNVLKIGGYCCKVLNRLEAKGFIRPSNLKVPSTF
ncbi:F-box/LRR-repeat protein 25-like [Bidens hawaiensis]|uniref:F-box/LRR-repeat protein 25-like n=1 Tax=Bidens hawaiensis TaxID=980011 RepID=UPI00404AD181